MKSSKYDYHYDEKQQTTDSGNSSEQEANDEDDEDYVVKSKAYTTRDIDNNYEQDEEEDECPDDEDEDEDFDDGATTNSMNSSSVDTYHTPLNKKKSLKGKRTYSRNIIQYSGSNPVRSCRREKPNSIYDEMVKSHYLRPAKRISYSEFFNEDGVSVKSHRNEGNNNLCSDMHSNTSEDESEDFVPLSVHRSIKTSSKKSYTVNLESRRLTRRQEKLLGLNSLNNGENKDKFRTEKNDDFQNFRQNVQEWVEVNEERIFLIDYGLASKFIDNGVHRPFVMDQRRAHDGTLEFTSRDAHMGAHSRRSDMECLGYNLLFWSQGYLPWKEAATNQQQEKVHRAKEFLMTDVRELLMQIYGKKVPKYLGEYLHLVGQLAYHERPDYNTYRCLLEREYEELGYPLGELRLQMTDIQQSCVRVKEEIENKNDFFETQKNNSSCNMVMNIMQNISVGGTPFHERTLSNRVSPKNLRSKSDKKDKKKKKFSWAEVLSQDPDQIARERAEKEFDREEELSDVQEPIVRRYQGKATNAIILLLGTLGRSVREYEEETIKMKKEQKERQIKNEIKMEMDECDNKKPHNNEDEVRCMEAINDPEDCHEQCGDGGETEGTDISEKYTGRKIKAASTLKRKLSNSKRKSNTNSKKRAAVARKLVLKTPVTHSNVGGKDSLTPTPICARTRRKIAAATVVDLVTPSPGVSKAKLMKSTKKRGSAIKSIGLKTPPSTATSSAPVAAASEEIEHQQGTSNNKRRNRVARRLLKTDLIKSESLQDESNSNFSPHVWKVNTEAIYSRNYRK